jgi:hypothetical protein
MPAENSQSDGVGAEVVREAASRSLTARGVRVYRARVREAGGGWTEPWSWEVGVADPAGRLVQVRHFYSDESPVVKLADAAARRWPWFAGEDGSGGAAEGESGTIEIGREYYYGGPAQWLDWSGDGFYAPARVLWALEAILGTIVAERASAVEVRNHPCVRYIGRVRPGEAAGVAEVKLVDRPGPGDEWRLLDAELCIDGSGRVRRIAWTPAIGTRIKPGVLPRLATALHGPPEPDPRTTPPGRLWNVLELWDYGCAVDITRPSHLMTEPVSFREMIGEVWRARHAYKQRTARPEPPRTAP